ncbi:hypothetical protein MCEGEM3_00839 [Oxalobacteraceae bacterium]|jgi:hypothetical protein
MKMNEIVTADEKLKLAQLIFKNTFDQLVPAAQVAQPQLVARPTAQPVKSKLKAPKRTPMAPAPKPSPKPKPLSKTKLVPQTPNQINHQQRKHPQGNLQFVKNTFGNDLSKIPKPARPLQNNTLKPLGLSDGEYKKNLELIRKPDELNRDIESKPQFSK